MKQTIYTDYHETRFQFDPSRAVIWKAIGEHLQQWIPENSHVLDLGCGYGEFINHIHAKKKYAVDLVDMSSYLKNDVHFLNTNFLDLDLDNQLDIVFASNVFEHISKNDISSYMNKIQALLKPGGKLIIIQPNFNRCYRNYYDDYTHVAAYTETGMKDLFTAFQFNILFSHPGYLPFSMKSLLPKSYYLTKLFLKCGSPLLGKQMCVVGQTQLK